MAVLFPARGRFLRISRNPLRRRELWRKDLLPARSAGHPDARKVWQAAERPANHKQDRPSPLASVCQADASKKRRNHTYDGRPRVLNDCQIQ